jgi:crossover junction endodeoxyribonuclease RuvC
VAEYSPSDIKNAIVGYGKADKRQMQEMVRIMLGLADVPQPDDAADALAIALCHAQTRQFTSRVGGSPS